MGNLRIKILPLLSIIKYNQHKLKLFWDQNFLLDKNNHNDNKISIKHILTVDILMDKVKNDIYQ